MSAVINYCTRKVLRCHNQMASIALMSFVLLISSSLVKCQSAQSSTVSTITTTSSYENQFHQTRHHPSLRNLIFPGFFLLRPSFMEAQLHHAIDVKPFAEIDNNELPSSVDQSTQSVIGLPPVPPPPPSAVNFARFTALKNRLSVDKAILPTMIPTVRQVPSDQVIKKIIYTSPRMMDTIPDLVME